MSKNELRIFCSVKFYFFYKPLGNIKQEGINLSADFHITAVHAEIPRTLLLPPRTPKVSYSPGAVSWTEGHSPGKCLRPQASTTLTLNVDVSDVWDSHNTSKYNAATLLRHESVGFKHLSSFLKLPLCFNMPLYSIFQVDVKAKLQHKLNSSCQNLIISGSQLCRGNYKF